MIKRDCLLLLLLIIFKNSFPQNLHEHIFSNNIYDFPYGLATNKILELKVP